MTQVDTRPDLGFVLDDDPPHERTIHRYPAHPRYRLSGADRPQLGDIALCGVRKDTMSRRAPGERLNCARCITLMGLRS